MPTQQNTPSGPFIRSLVAYARQNDVPPKDIFDRAEKCEILPYLMFALANGDIEPAQCGLTEIEVNERMVEFKARQTARLMLWKTTYIRVAKAIESPFILLKGAPLGACLTGNALWRATNDVDLWLPDFEEAEAAVKKLESMGYCLEPDNRVYAKNQFLLTHAVLAPVEIHWKLAPPPWLTPSFGNAMKRHAVFSWQGLEIPVLGDDDLIVHLVLHAHQHYFALKTVIDFALAHDKITVNSVMLRQFRISRIYRLLEDMIRAFERSELPFMDRAVAKLASCWFEGMLGNSKRGELVFGRDSSVIAAIGVLIRALSMTVMDGSVYPKLAAGHVLLKGPHRIGYAIFCIEKRVRMWRLEKK